MLIVKIFGWLLGALMIYGGLKVLFRSQFKINQENLNNKSEGKNASDEEMTKEQR